MAPPPQHRRRKLLDHRIGERIAHLASLTCCRSSIGQWPIAEAGHLFAMSRGHRFDLRTGQRLAPLPGLARAEEPLRVGGALDEAVTLLLLAQHLERAELHGFV